LKCLKSSRANTIKRENFIKGKEFINKDLDLIKLIKGMKKLKILMHVTID